MNRMINYAIVRDQESDRNVAVVAHDPGLARVVFKVRDPDGPIDRSLNLHYDRSLIIQEPVEINGSVIMKRRRAIQKDEDYLNYLLDKAVKIPYEVRTIQQIDTSDRLDTFIDRLAKEQLDGKKPRITKKKRAVESIYAL